jgi:hypothetical protein
MLQPKSVKLLAFLLAVAFLPSSPAFKVVIPIGKTECISENIESQHFQVRQVRQ